MREIIFDTETTGLDPLKGDRMVEIGCIELVNRVPTGQVFHAYFNPCRDMPAEAEAVHGLSAAFLADKPLFGERCAELLEFIGDALWWRTTPDSTSPFSILSWPNAGSSRCATAGWWIRSRSRGSAIPGPSSASTRCAPATGSTAATAPATARCSTPNCWPRSMSS